MDGFAWNARGDLDMSGNMKTAILNSCVPELVVKYGNLLEATLTVFDADISGHYLKAVDCPCSVCNLWRVVQSQFGGNVETQK